MYRLIPFLILSALVAGCTSAKQLAERNNERCAARGLAPDSKAFSDCLTQLESEGDARREANRRALLERPVDLPMNR